jgi:Zn-dependent peptidase ImmA (M78 family)/transcriptional regulator with XRE-family HTH domain
MTSSAQLHETLRALRELRGLTLASLAREAELPLSALEEAEAGGYSAEVIDGLSRYYQLDADFLIGEDSLQNDATSSVFCYRGDATTFVRDDLLVINRVAQRARIYVGATAEGKEGLRRRRRFEPQPVAGEQTNTEWRQGYRLARHVRATLGLDTKPVDDLGAWITHEFGVLISTERLTDRNYQACAVLDRERSAAAILLSGTSHRDGQSTLRQRVFLAHELCHLLFDVTKDDAITISADVDIEQKSKVGVERRARAFAAELLIPRDGLIKRFGEPRLRRGDEAVDLVEDVRRVFGVPWQAAGFHLMNMGYLDDHERLRLNADSALRGDAPAWPTQTLSVSDLASPAGDGVEERANGAWEASRAANEEATRADERVVTEWLACVYDALRGEKPGRARLAVTMGLDDALSEGKLRRVTMLLERLDVAAVPPSALSGALVVTRDAKDELGEHRRAFVDRVDCALRDHHGWSIKDRDELRQRLA